MLSPTRAEDGCSFYRLFEAREPGLFYFYELWRDEGSLNAHAESVHFKEMQLKLKDLLLEPLEVSLVREIGAESWGATVYEVVVILMPVGDRSFVSRLNSKTNVILLLAICDF
jgi:quinol monooxygenase YgiN